MATRRRRSKKWISWVILLILLIGAGIVCYLVWENYFKEEEIISEDETSSEIIEVSEEAPSEEEPIVKEEVVQYDGEDPNNLGEISGVVTYAEVSGDYLVIRVNIDQYLSSGVCTLRLEEFGAEIYREETNLTSSASTATCEGFNVPLSATGTGEFKIFIDVEAEGKNGVISGEVTI